MARETVGYVHMQWTCPSCGSRNSGLESVCTSCGAAQPDDVKFEQMAQEELIQDERLAQKAKVGPDIHCAFCGARNPGDATHCQQCMADLSAGSARVSGRVVGAHRAEAAPDVACAYCGAMNPANAMRCAQCNSILKQPQAAPQPEKTAAPAPSRRSRWLVLAGAALLLILCGALALFMLRTEEMVGQVAEVEWTRSVAVEVFGPVEYQDWRDQIPSGAVVGACSQEVRRVQEEPAPNAERVCGTPYTVDTGTGLGEVVQDCEYHVYEDRCAYTVEEWYKADEVTLRGSDFSPRWPEPALSSGQRAGERSEQYEIVFDADGRTYTYRTRSAEEFGQFTVGSSWILEVNPFNAVVRVSPDR